MSAIRDCDKEEQRKACSSCKKSNSIEECLKMRCPYFVLQNYDEYEENFYKQTGLRMISNWRIKQ